MLRQLLRGDIYVQQHHRSRAAAADQTNIEGWQSDSAFDSNEETIFTRQEEEEQKASAEQLRAEEIDFDTSSAAESEKSSENRC